MDDVGKKAQAGCLCIDLRRRFIRRDVKAEFLVTCRSRQRTPYRENADERPSILSRQIVRIEGNTLRPSRTLRANRRPISQRPYRRVEFFLPSVVTFG
ncbi:MAG: hypothetical protein IH991_00180 [Planctomycetes bacterium]|nr:hypothetical protein [Planctomycetota bacterium]